VRISAGEPAVAVCCVIFGPFLALMA